MKAVVREWGSMVLKENVPIPVIGGSDVLIAINGGPELWLRQFSIGQKKNQHLVILNPNSADFTILSKLADEGWVDGNGKNSFLSPVLDDLLPLNSKNVQKGFDRLKSRRTRGKIVFDISIDIDTLT